MSDWNRPQDDADARAVLRAFVWTLVAFKLVTSVMILYYFPSRHALIMVVALSSAWVIAGVWYAGVVTRVKMRLLRGRARRRQLLDQEWNVD